MYQHKVRIGNWYEDTCLAEDTQKNFKENIDRGHLIVSKARALYDNFNNDIVLDAPKEFICFGSVVQILPYHINVADVDTTELNPALSIVINDNSMRQNQTINIDCEITVGPTDIPCIRNSFRIVSGDEKDRNNEVLKYGQHFRIECCQKLADDPFWLYTRPKLMNLEVPMKSTFMTRRNGEVNLPLGLIRRSDCAQGKDMQVGYTNWLCVHKEPQKRFETLGRPLPSNTPMVIKHVATNKNLAVENVVVNTLFGPEFACSVQTYRNVMKQETWKNIWMISNGAGKLN